MNAEEKRLEESRDRKSHWKRWGPYLSERQWGTVREDYSEYGTAWDFFPHDHARSRTYRWGEDGLMGISDDQGLACFALGLWNERDPILKERLFGLTAHEGNHGEDVKEYYFYLDNTPTHSYMRYLYKYPHAAFPYAALIEENRRRTRQQREYELADTGVFAESRYFKDSFHEYLVQRDANAVNPLQIGTKAAAHYGMTIEPGREVTVRLRFTDALPESHQPGVGDDFDVVLNARKTEADAFYRDVVPADLSPDAALVMRQSIAGLLWSKQFYHYIVRDW